MKEYTTPLVTLVGAAAATIQGGGIPDVDSMGDPAGSSLPSNLEEE